MLLRNAVILGLVAVGFVIFAKSEPFRWAVGFWVMAAVYAFLTSPKRFL